MRKLRWLVMFLVLFLAAGCAGKVALTPNRAVPFSQDLAESASRKLAQVERSRGDFSLVLTEAEATSLLRSYAAEKPEDTPVQDPTIWFEPGRIIAAGKLVNVVPGSFDFVVVMEVEGSATPLKLRFRTIKVGKLSLPDAVLGLLSRTATETLAETETWLRINRIEIKRGVLEVQGRFVSKE